MFFWPHFPRAEGRGLFQTRFPFKVGPPPGGGGLGGFFLGETFFDPYFLGPCGGGDPRPPLRGSQPDPAPPGLKKKPVQDHGGWVSAGVLKLMHGRRRTPLEVHVDDAGLFIQNTRVRVTTPEEALEVPPQEDAFLPKFLNPIHRPCIYALLGFH